MIISESSGIVNFNFCNYAIRHGNLIFQSSKTQNQRFTFDSVSKNMLNNLSNYNSTVSQSFGIVNLFNVFTRYFTQKLSLVSVNTLETVKMGRRG